MKKTALILFALSSIAVILSDILSIGWLHITSKPLIMVSLFFYYLFSVESENRSRSLFLAIAFSFAGDVLLIKDEYFILGLVAFLLSHVLYIFAYRQHQTEESENSLAGLQKIRLAFPILLAATGLVVILYPALNDLKIPVMIYATVIALMMINALLRYGKTSSESFWLVFFGATLFFISDSILAVNKFLQTIDHAGALIMFTYCAAQFLIVHGLIKHPKSEYASV